MEPDERRAPDRDAPARWLAPRPPEPRPVPLVVPVRPAMAPTVAGTGDRLGYRLAPGRPVRDHPVTPDPLRGHPGGVDHHQLVSPGRGDGVPELLVLAVEVRPVGTAQGEARNTRPGSS
ncbi:hypothetical protein GCM10009609_50870 [Pseudonocardia aurantiaca]